MVCRTQLQISEFDDKMHGTQNKANSSREPGNQPYIHMKLYIVYNHINIYKHINNHHKGI